MDKIFSAKIRDFPLPAKSLAFGFCLALGLAYLYAMGNIFLAIGLTPQKIAIHYYGAPEKINENKSPSSPAGEQTLDLGKPTLEPAAEFGPRPSFKNLVAEGHFHLFGMTSFFFCLTFLGLFTGISAPWKSFWVFLPYVAIIFDNISFLATRFLGPHFAYLTAVSGALMGTSFFVLWVLILKEIFTKGAKVA
jgi:hypothetical protein